MNQKKQLGFTLIEAIVALVLIGTTGLMLFSWINTNITTLHRVQEINKQNDATLNVLEYMNAINPMLRPSGMIIFGGYKATWEAELIVAAKDGARYPTGIGLYQFALYRTKINVIKIPEEAWFTINLQQVGYKKVRGLKAGL